MSAEPGVGATAGTGAIAALVGLWHTDRRETGSVHAPGWTQSKGTIR